MLCYLGGHGGEADGKAGPDESTFDHLGVELDGWRPGRDLGNPDLQVAEERHQHGRPDFGALAGETYEARVEHGPAHVLFLQYRVANRDLLGEADHRRLHRAQAE